MVADDVPQAIRAHEDRCAFCEAARDGIDFDGLILANRTVQHVALGVVFAFLWGDLVQLDQALHIAVIAREQLNLFFGDDVDAAVANVGEVAPIAEQHHDAEGCAAVGGCCAGRRRWRP